MNNLSIVITLLFAGSLAAASPRPNVVFILADDLGWGDISCNGGDIPTPHIDRLFAQGVRLNQFLVNPVCSPTRAAFLTGRDPLRINQGPSVDGVLDPAVPTIARDFQSAGYATGAFGKWHNSAPPKFAHLKNEPVHHVSDYGFGRFVGFYGGGVDCFTKIWPNTTDSPTWYHDRAPVDDEPGHTGELITHHALEFVRNHKRDPFFCYVAQGLIHTPLQPGERVLDRIPASFYAAAGGRETVEEYYLLGCKAYGQAGASFVEAHNRLKGTHYQWSAIPQPTKAQERVLYAAMVIALDDCVGQVVETLQGEGLLENTILLLASDNGATPHGNNQPWRGHKHSLWEGGIHVPACVHWSAGGLTAANYRQQHDAHGYDGLVRISDLYPTLASLCVVDVTGTQLEGADLSEAILQNDPPRRDGFYYFWRSNEVWRGDRWKFFRSADPAESKLFDLRNDPGETHDVAKQHPEVVRALSAKMDAYVAAHGLRPASVPIKDTGPARPEGDVLSIEYSGAAPRNKPELLFGFGRKVERGLETNGQATDVLVYDLRVEPGSASRGFHVGFSAWSQAYFYDRGVAPDGSLFRDYDYKPGVWQRIKVGMADFAPSPQSRIQFFVHPELEKAIDVQIDNVHIERADGSRIDLWHSGPPRAAATSAELSVQKLPR